jgi:hypothetical protein
MRSFCAPEMALLARSQILSPTAFQQTMHNSLLGIIAARLRKRTNRGVGVINDHDLKGRLSNDTVVLRLITTHS